MFTVPLNPALRHHAEVIALIISRHDMMSVNKTYDCHVFPATTLGKQQLEAKINEANSFYDNMIMFLTGRKYALYCADKTTVHTSSPHYRYLCCLHNQIAPYMRNNLSAFPIPISLPNYSGLVAQPHFTNLYLKRQLLSVESTIESQRFLADCCGDLVPVLEIESRVVIEVTSRFFLILTVIVVSFVLWATGIVDRNIGVTLVGVCVTIVLGSKWVLHG